MKHQNKMYEIDAPIPINNVKQLLIKESYRIRTKEIPPEIFSVIWSHFHRTGMDVQKASSKLGPSHSSGSR